MREVSYRVTVRCPATVTATQMRAAILATLRLHLHIPDKAYEIDVLEVEGLDGDDPVLPFREPDGH